MKEGEAQPVTFTEVIRDAIAQKRIVKWGYVRQFGGIYPSDCDSVAAHSNSVAVLSILLGSEIGSDLYAKTSVELNLETIALMATFHDYGEGRSGDTGASSYSIRGVCNLHSLEREGLERSLRGLKVQSRLLDLWDDYRAYRTPEAILVHIADNLEGFEKALHAGRGSLEVIEDVFRILNENMEIYRDRGKVAADVGVVTPFLVSRLLIPGILAIAEAYNLLGRLEELVPRWSEWIFPLAESPEYRPRESSILQVD